MTILLALLLAGAEARFEPAGVRFGDVLHTGALLELRAGALVSGNVVEALADPLRVELGQGLTLTVEPGVRVARDVDGLRLSAHAPARLRMSALSETWENVVVRRTASGWAVGERELAGEIRVSLQAQPQQPQDDPEATIRRSEEAARRMREGSQRVRPPMRRRVFSGFNPTAGGEAASSQAIRQLVELSLTGS